VTKAIVLAAGRGRRLGVITEKIPKPMLEVNGEIILEHNLKWLRENGVRQIYINLHYLPQVIRNYFGDGRKYGLDISYSFESRILGTAGAVKKIADDWAEPFLVIYGDNFYPADYDLSDLTGFHFGNNAFATIGAYKKKSEIWKSGVIIADRDNLIVDFKEKPERTAHTAAFIEQALINTGIYLLDGGITDYIPGGFSDFGRDIFPGLLAERRPLYAYVFDSALVAIDTARLYRRAVKQK